ncbi:MAG: ABC transporter permease, partial [Clostridia bacterium]|nr:ABC transporter permease [Deltaproteobacteria bacterium]
MTVVIVSLGLAQLVLLWLGRRHVRSSAPKIAAEPRNTAPAGREFSIRTAIFCAIALAVSGVGLWLVYAKTELTLERDPPLLWAWTALSAMAVGGVAASRVKRMPAWEMFLGCLVVLDGIAVLALYGPGDHGLTAAPLRALLIAPAVLAACTYFGASIGYLFFAAGARGRRVGYEAAIGRRFLLSKSSPTVSIVTTISIIGVAFGVNLVIVGLSILSGFEDDLRTKIIGANAHATIESARGDPFEITHELLDAVADTPGVVAAAPYVQGEVAVASSANFTGSTVLVGIDPQRSPDVLDVLKTLAPGRGTIQALQLDVDARPKPTEENPDFAPPSRTAGIVIGIEMANSLQLKLGDRIRVLSPFLEVLTPIGVAPKSVGLQVVGIFASKMYEYDAHLAFVSLGEARSFFELGSNDVTGIQILTADPERSDLIGG